NLTDLTPVLVKNVYQTPVIFASFGNPVELFCNHSYSNFDQIYWYQQTRGNTELKLIGYANYDQMYPEDSFKARFKLNGHGSKELTVRIDSITFEDSAVYFCAASEHSSAERVLISQKPAHHSILNI
uniref:Ig-like domain-containing protein n=1 Tax=Erpetoichthys calabaricus TaxID=27687 RepID=A0A8C4RRZ2_ERPCA